MNFLAREISCLILGFPLYLFCSKPDGRLRMRKMRGPSDWAVHKRVLCLRLASLSFQYFFSELFEMHFFFHVLHVTISFDVGSLLTDSVKWHEWVFGSDMFHCCYASLYPKYENRRKKMNFSAREMSCLIIAFLPPLLFEARQQTENEENARPDELGSSQ